MRCLGLMGLLPVLLLSQLQMADSLSDKQLALLAKWEQQNFLVGIAKTGYQLEPATECGKQLGRVLQAVARQEYWSTKLLDAFGAAPQAFGWGNYFWFSAAALCHDLKKPHSTSFEPSAHFNASSPMEMGFSMLYMNFTSPHYIDLRLPFERYISLGLCLPTVCNMSALIHYGHMYFARNLFELPSNFALKLTTVVEAKQPSFNLQIFQQTSSLLFIALLLCLFVLSTAAQLQRKSCMWLAAALQCFRLSHNYQQALRADRLDAKGNGDYLSAIAGLRCIVCLWVTIFHVYYYSLFAMSNATLIFTKLEQLALQPIIQACFFVDVFFVISAFLLVYHFLRHAEQLQQIQHNRPLTNLRLFLKALARRYLRLTPVLVVTMLLSDMLHNALNAATPFLLGRHNGLYCKHTWWHNLLYIQNWLNLDDICCSWTWYLACDMQYFVLCLTLLFIYAKRPKAAQLAYVALLLICLPLAWLSSSRNLLTFRLDSIFGTLNQVYAKPWTRILPYLGGMFAGWLLHWQQTQSTLSQLKWARAWRWTFWFVACCLLLATSFITYWRAASTTVVASVMSVGKLLFALTIGLVIALCSCGFGGPLRVLLSARLWRILNKFCYGIYMMAPLIVFASFGLRTMATQFSEVASGNDVVAIIVLSTAAALLWWLLLERPAQRLAQLLADSASGHQAAQTCK